MKSIHIIICIWIILPNFVYRIHESHVSFLFSIVIKEIKSIIYFICSDNCACDRVCVYIPTILIYTIGLQYNAIWYTILFKPFP